MATNATLPRPPVAEPACVDIRPLDEALDELLSSWHSWARMDRGVEGFSSKAPVVGDFRGWRLQYDGQLDQLEAERQASVCETVEAEVNQLGEPHCSAIRENARNLSTGWNVWRSPRLPADREECALILALARRILAKRLISAGVLESA